MDSNEIREKILRLGGKIYDAHVIFPNGLNIKNRSDALDILDLMLLVIQETTEDGPVPSDYAKFVDIFEPLAALKAAIESGAVAKKRRGKK